MRFHHIYLIALMLCAGTVQATETIPRSTLDQTLLDAQNAVENDDFEQAFTLYNQAAQWGHKGAQYVLGELYIQGKGVARDPVAGYAWLEVAAESPDREFRKARSAAGKKLTDEQRQKATELAAQLAASFGVDAAGITCRREMRVGSNIKVVNCYHRTTNSGDLIVPDQQSGLVPAS